MRSKIDLNKTIESLYEENTLFSWEPSPLGNRIVAQSSFFVFGAPVIPANRLTKLVVQADSKRNILAQLETTFGINEEALVPDFPGYAVANAPKKTFDVGRAVAYWTEQTKLAKNDSQRSLAHFNCGVAYSAIRDFENAIDHFDQSTQFRKFSVAYNNRGFVRVELGQYKEAVIDFGKAIEVNPNSELAYNNRGAAYTKLRLFREAISDLDKAILLDPEYADAYHNRGIARSMLNQNNEAIEDFSMVISLDLNYVEAYLRRGLVRLALNQLDEAVVDFDEAIILYPDYTEAFRKRGATRIKLGQHDLAIRDFERAISLDPDHPEAYRNRGISKSFLGQHKDAIEDLNTALEIDPDCAAAYDNRGVAKLAVGHKKEAASDFCAALRIDPNHDSARQHLESLKAGNEEYPSQHHTFSDNP